MEFCSFIYVSYFFFFFFASTMATFLSSWLRIFDVRVDITQKIIYQSTFFSVVGVFKIFLACCLQLRMKNVGYCKFLNMFLMVSQWGSTGYKSCISVGETLFITPFCLCVVMWPLMYEVCELNWWLSSVEQSCEPPVNIGLCLGH